MNIDILYEDDYIVVMNTLADLVVYFDGKTKEPSVSEWFLSKYPSANTE